MHYCGWPSEDRKGEVPTDGDALSMFLGKAMTSQLDVTGSSLRSLGSAGEGLLLQNPVENLLVDLDHNVAHFES